MNKTHVFSIKIYLKYELDVRANKVLYFRFQFFGQLLNTYFCVVGILYVSIHLLVLNVFYNKSKFAINL